MYYDYFGGTASCALDVISLPAINDYVWAGLAGPVDPNLKNGGVDVYADFDAVGTGSGSIFLISYPSQATGGNPGFTNGHNTVTLTQPTTGDANVGLQVYGGGSFTGTVSNLCIGTTNPPVCSAPPTPTSTPMTTGDMFPVTLFLGIVILYAGLLTPIRMGQFIDTNGTT